MRWNTKLELDVSAESEVQSAVGRTPTPSNTGAGMGTGRPRALKGTGCSRFLMYRSRDVVNRNAVLNMPIF